MIVLTQPLDQFAFQKGLEATLLPAEAGANILDNFIELLKGTDGLLEVCDLSFEISALFFAADAGIEDFRFLWWLELGTLLVSKQSVDVGGRIQSLAIPMCSDKGKLSRVSPTSKGRPRDCIALQHVGGRNVSSGGGGGRSE